MAEKVPQYRRIYEILRKHIEKGLYKEGDLLPSENELCKIHNSTRPTVRQALNTLVNAGYILRQQGKGSIVNRVPQGIGILSVEGTTSVIGGENLKTKIIVKPYVDKWPDDFFFNISETEVETGCICMERLRLYKEKPIFYDVNYLPNMGLARFTSRNLENKSLFEVLRHDYQIETRGGEQRLRATLPDKKISEQLKISSKHPVLHLERKIHTNKIGFFIYSSMYCNTELDAIYGTF